MKTLRIWLALVVIGIAAALFFGRSRVETGTVARPWPLGLGMVTDAPKRFPVTKDSEAATKLVALARKMGVELRTFERGWGVDRDVRDAFADYLQTQLERGSDAIDAPPSEVARWLTDHDATLDEIRELARTGGPIVFASDIKKPPYEEGLGLAGLQHLHRAFVTRALVAARAGDRDAWNELEIVWALTEPLWSRPDSMAVLTGSTGARFVNSAAGKLPMPPEPWFQEVSTFDYARALLSAQQAEVWRENTPAFNVRVRGMAEEVLRAKACDVTSPQFTEVKEKLGARAAPNLVEAWERLMRFRAEREATERVMLLRQGRPIAAASQCSDGTWQVTTKSFQFSRDIPVRSPQIEYALKYSR